MSSLPEASTGISDTARMSLGHQSEGIFMSSSLYLRSMHA